MLAGRVSQVVDHPYIKHRTLRMTIRYARIANHTVADEYHAVSAKVEALYAQPPNLGPDAEGPTMRRVRAEHHRMLGNGWCTRPAELDCSFETICESCGFFATTTEFKPTLTRQAHHAATHDQPGRADLYTRLAAAADLRIPVIPFTQSGGFRAWVRRPCSGRR